MEVDKGRVKFEEGETQKSHLHEESKTTLAVGIDGAIKVTEGTGHWHARIVTEKDAPPVWLR